MSDFCVKPTEQITKNRIVIHEGKYRNGIYHLFKLDRDASRADFISPPQFSDPAFTQGWSQKKPQGRMVPGEEFDRAFAKPKEFWEVGKQHMDNFIRTHPLAYLISDASNNPFHEGGFAISGKRLLPIPTGSYPIFGKHYVLSTANGRVSFPIVDLEDESSIRNAEEGFFVPKIIHEGQPIRLLDEVPGTGQISIADYRGHIGQLVKEAGYSEMNSQRRVDIHTQILEYLREPRQYMAVLKNILAGQAIDFGQYGPISFSLNTYNHTYWLETDGGALYCFKTYASPDGSAAGVIFGDGPDLLFAIGRQYNFKIKNAFIGTNGRDVRMVFIDSGQPIRLIHSLDGIALGDATSFARPSANFIVFSWLK